MNFAEIDELVELHPELDLIFVESGGGNLAATFSQELVDFSIYIIDVAQGEKIPRKGGQGMIKSDLSIDVHYYIWSWYMFGHKVSPLSLILLSEALKVKAWEFFALRKDSFCTLLSPFIKHSYYSFEIY